MPDQAGTWLGSRRARRRVPQVDGYWPGPGSDRRQRAGAGRVPHCANTFVQSANVAVWYAVRTSGPHPDRVASQTRLAKLREG